jgi:protein-tyrosine phosphatase
MANRPAPTTGTEPDARPDGESHGPPTVRQILFLCTGNYYRSRFAEELWHHLERGEPSGWRAQSRGLRVAGGYANVGPISPHALHGLGERGVRLLEPMRPPRQVDGDDFIASAHVVALSLSEHREMVASLFPKWVDAVEYWDIEDIALSPVAAALEMLCVHLRALRSRLLGRRLSRRP